MKSRTKLSKLSKVQLKNERFKRLQHKYFSYTKKTITIKGDLQMSINYAQASDISDFQKILLKSNGTVTALLEAYFSEPIKVVKISEKLDKIEFDLPNLKLNKEEQVLASKILLQGKNSRRNFIYADSLILINNLEKRFTNELLNTDKPIGKIWSEQKIETFIEILNSGEESANILSNYFCIKPEENLLSRTYSVLSKGKITMIITEKFPHKYFLPKYLLV